MTRYTIRYRGTDTRGRTVLIVEDRHRAAYLVCAGQLQARLAADDAADPCGRLAALLADQAAWTSEPPGATWWFQGQDTERHVALANPLVATVAPEAAE